MFCRALTGGSAVPDFRQRAGLHTSAVNRHRAVSEDTATARPRSAKLRPALLWTDSLPTDRKRRYPPQPRPSFRASARPTGTRGVSSSYRGRSPPPPPPSLVAEAMTRIPRPSLTGASAVPCSPTTCRPPLTSSAARTCLSGEWGTRKNLQRCISVRKTTFRALQCPDVFQRRRNRFCSAGTGTSYPLPKRCGRPGESLPLLEQEIRPARCRISCAPLPDLRMAGCINMPLWKTPVPSPALRADMFFLPPSSLSP